MPQATKIQSRLYTLFMVVITPHFAKGDGLGHLNPCRISKLSPIFSNNMSSAFAFDASEHHNVDYQVLIFSPMAISHPP